MINMPSSSRNKHFYPLARISRKSTFVVFAYIGLIVVLVTSKRLAASWSIDRPYSRHDCKSHYAPQGYLADNESGTGLNAVLNDTSDWGPKDTLDKSNPDFPHRSSPKTDSICNSFPDTRNILLVMKTGASESFIKIPTQLMKVMRCLDDFLIFGDMDQRVAGYRIHDSLETVLAEAKDDNSDFDLYRRQQWCVVDQDNCNKLGNPASEGWNLDKYKNIHIAEKTYSMRPNYDWYIFIDADTYVLWHNMVEFLSKLRPSKEQYIGSVAMHGNFPYAHGGSGYIVSQAAMKEFVGKNPGIANKYDVRAKSECCGDILFALAIEEVAKIGTRQVWPTLNGGKPSNLLFGPSHWCHPIATMHHMNSEEVSAFWDWERRQYTSNKLPRTLLLKDIFFEFLEPKLRQTREDWNNLSDNRYYVNKTDPGHQ